MAPLLDARDPAAIEAAAERLARGGLLAFPTETVYGLGARADDDAAVQAIFRTKGRPSGHPLIVHVADAAAARHWAARWPAAADRLAHAFWPGPLTLIVPRRDGIGAVAAGGQDTIGLRCPAHPAALALLRSLARRGVPGVAGPSANRFGRVSPTRASHVRDEFGDTLAILDGGDCEAGIESSIVDCSGPHPVALRPGVIPRERLEAALGEPLRAPGAATTRSSGDLPSHYAPDARVELLDATVLEGRLRVLAASPEPPAPPGRLGVYCRSRWVPVPGIDWRQMPDDPLRAAHELFAVLRGFDDRGVQRLWVEAPPDDAGWDGVRDRLTRAAAPR